MLKAIGERDRMLVAESYFSEGKLKNDFGAAFLYLYTHNFWSLSRDFSI